MTKFLQWDLSGGDHKFLVTSLKRSSLSLHFLFLSPSGLKINVLVVRQSKSCTQMSSLSCPLNISFVRAGILPVTFTAVSPVHSTSSTWQTLNSCWMNAWLFYHYWLPSIFIITSLFMKVCWFYFILTWKKCLSISEQYNEVASAFQWQNGKKRKCYFLWKAFEMMIKSWWFFQTANWKHYWTYLPTFANSFLRTKILPYLKFCSTFH